MKDNAEMTPKGYGSGTKPPAGANASDYVVSATAKW